MRSRALDASSKFSIKHLSFCWLHFFFVRKNSVLTFPRIDRRTSDKRRFFLYVCLNRSSLIKVFEQCLPVYLVYLLDWLGVDMTRCFAIGKIESFVLQTGTKISPVFKSNVSVLT